VGDILMQQAALRNRRQLRAEDMVGRLGGDEFAGLVPVVQNPSDVEEIALRLKRCFRDPFGVEGYIVRGSASVGVALYPADATTRDGLLTAADSAMYAEKHKRKRKKKVPEGQPDPELTSESRSQEMHEPAPNLLPPSFDLHDSPDRVDIRGSFCRYRS